MNAVLRRFRQATAGGRHQQLPERVEGVEVDMERRFRAHDTASVHSPGLFTTNSLTRF